MSNPAIAMQGLGSMSIPSLTFTPSRPNPSRFVSTGFTGRTLSRPVRFVASSSSLMQPPNTTGALGQNISSQFQELNSAADTDAIITQEAPSYQTIGNAVSEGLEATEAVTDVVGEAESAVDDVPDISPLISAGAIVAQGIGDSQAAAVAQDGTVSSRMRAGNIARETNAVTNDIVAGSSLGSVLGPIGSALGSIVSGLIGGFATQQNTLTDTSGRDLNPSDTNVRFD